MAENKYYWLKLKEDFFKRQDIRIIEEMQNGKDYVLFYLKMLLEGISNNGELRFNEEIPYNEQMLSVITNTNIDVVRAAMKIFSQLGMVEVYEDMTICMKEVQALTGSESASTARMRKARAKKALESDNSTQQYDVAKQEYAITEGRCDENVEHCDKSASHCDKPASHCDNKVQKCDTDIEIDIEKEIDIEIDIEIEKEIDKEKAPQAARAPARHKYGEYKNVLLSDEDIEKLKAEFPSDWQERIERLSEYIASSGKSYKNYLATIRNWAKRDKEKTAAEKKQKNGGWCMTEDDTDLTKIFD